MYILSFDLGNSKTGMVLYNKSTKEVKFRTTFRTTLELDLIYQKIQLKLFNIEALLIETCSGEHVDELIGSIIYKTQRNLKYLTNVRTIPACEWQKAMFKENFNLGKTKAQAKLMAQEFLNDELKDWSVDEIDAYLVCKWYERTF